jgi:tRNA-splicing ligase RtcB
VPHGRTEDGRRHDKGAWKNPPANVAKEWAALAVRFDEIAKKHPAVSRANHETHLGTLGTGNHFIEVCLDESGSVWFVLHSGSRGGKQDRHVLHQRRAEEMRRHFINLPDLDCVPPAGIRHFDDYVEAVGWRRTRPHEPPPHDGEPLGCAAGARAPPFAADLTVVNCHHNYVEGFTTVRTCHPAVRAREGELGITWQHGRARTS